MSSRWHRGRTGVVTPRVPSRDNLNREPSTPSAGRPWLPVILVPGFMSTGLKVASSETKPEWKGQRVWINLPKLGFAAAHTKGVFDDGGSQALKNKWLEHLMLKSAAEEYDGVHLEPVPGVDGVDFLDPDSVFGLLSGPTLVFAPVIKALLRMGYVVGEDLEAASYDWRFAPSLLEERAGYFSGLREMIERMDERGTGVVLLAHSMGNKTVAYFLEFAKRMYGQEWVDEHIYSWVAVGAPHLGAPAAARATLLGDRMGLEAFLTMPEAILMGRSFSSSPWLFPVGAKAEHVFYWRRQGMLELKSFEASLPGIGLESIRNFIKLCIEVSWGERRRETSCLDTKSSVKFDGAVAEFEPESNRMQFGGPAELSRAATICVTVKEKGLFHDGGPLKSASQHGAEALSDGLHVITEGIRKGRVSAGVPRARTATQSLVELLEQPADSAGFVHVKMQLDKLLTCGRLVKDSWRSGWVVFEMRWHDADAIRRLATLPGHAPHMRHTPSASAALMHRLTSRLERVPICHRSLSHQLYEPITQLELLHFEGCHGVLDTWRDYYEADDLCNTTGVDDCPPIGRVTSVFGVNVPTEVMYALRINTVRLKPSSVGTRMVLDDEAILASPIPRGLSMKGGVVSEVGDEGRRPSGDGTVPYASLEHCYQWRGRVEVTLHPLHKVEHRQLLSSAQFHEVLWQTLMPKSGFSTKWQSLRDARRPSLGWTDLPSGVSKQLDKALGDELSSIEIQYRENNMQVDLQAMMQRNVQTGLELPVRRVAAPRSHTLQLLSTRCCGQPVTGYSKAVPLVDQSCKLEAKLAATRAVQQDPEDTVAVVSYSFTLFGGYWTATAYTARAAEAMTYRRLRCCAGFILYSEEARSPPPSSWG